MSHIDNKIHLLVKFSLQQLSEYLNTVPGMFDASIDVHLRQGDHLQHLADLINQLIERTRK